MRRQEKKDKEFAKEDGLLIKKISPDNCVIIHKCKMRKRLIESVLVLLAVILLIWIFS